ncbi:MAG: FkbM family methyltransferase [Acidimicrobiia bacterium]|nr:FkbM family methyltransferase [Acidimicrobiia bacterium]
MTWPEVQFLARGWKARFRDHRAEIAALTGALEPTDIAVDVGANKGSFLPSLARALPKGLVVAFEPQPVLATYLRDAVRRAKLSNVLIEAVGVSDRAGTLSLAIPGDSESSPGASFEDAVRARGRCRVIDAPVVTLGQYFAYEPRHIGAIKIDVEGHELSVLRGAEQILRAHRPIVVCESEDRHISTGGVTAVLAFFASLGYEGFFVHRGRLVPVADFNPLRHQRAEGERFWDDRDYCNNFIMSPLPR